MSNSTTSVLNNFDHPASQHEIEDRFSRARSANEELSAFASFAEVPQIHKYSPRTDKSENVLLSSKFVAIKDLIDLEGFPTRAGSLATTRDPVAKSAFVVTRLSNAGGIIVGKTNTVEFGFGGWGTNPSTGTPRNPWDMHVHRVPGGSSSGSAVAVAAGLVHVALGTDTGGSIRTPASYCGIFGMKPSPGLVSRAGVFPLSPSLDTVGVLSAKVADAAATLQAIAGPDPEDSLTSKSPEIDFLRNLYEGVSGLRLAVLEGDELMLASEEMRATFLTTVNFLKNSGAIVHTFTPPRTLMYYLSVAGDIMAAESYATLAKYIEDEGSVIHPVIRARILRGKTISNDQYVELLDCRESLKQEYQLSVREADAFLTPTCVEHAIPLSEVNENRIVTPFGRFVNLLDLPAASIPIGLSTMGLPLGIQIVAKRNGDPTVLRVSMAIERGFCHPRLPCWHEKI